MNTKIGNIANYLAVILLLGTGLIYLLKNSFMPYHSEAVSLEWNEVYFGTQFLILALMRAISGGFIAIAIVIAFLQNKFSSTKIKWLPIIILISGLIVGITSIYATLIVKFNTAGSPPTLSIIIGILLLIIGYIFNKKYLNEN
jgi:hypothetical protein